MPRLPRIFKYLGKYIFWKLLRPRPTRKGHINNKNADIHYTVYGSGRPILLLHGGLSNKLSWFSQVPVLLENGFKVVLVDTRGHGRSTHGNNVPNYHIYAEDTLCVLDDLGVERVDIIGWSDGGNTALQIGYDHPERAGKIIAVSANYHYSGLKAQARKENTQPSRGIMRWLSRMWTKMGRNFHTVEKQIKTLWQTSPEFTSEMLSTIAAPTLIVVGEYDCITLEHSKIMADKIEHGSLQVIMGAGHAAPITHAKIINSIILDFLVNKVL